MATTRWIGALAALACTVALAGCVEERYYGGVELGGPVYEPRYPEPYYDYSPGYEYYRYERYGRRYDRYDRRYDRPRPVRPDNPRPGRPDYPRPSRPDPIVDRPRPPREQPRDLPRGQIDCGGTVKSINECFANSRGTGWGKTN